MNNVMALGLSDELKTNALGEVLAQLIVPGDVLWLKGDLGAGKTALTRAILRAMGVDGPLVSPTYTLIEHYQTVKGVVWHIDCYRLGDPEELEYLGMRDYERTHNVMIVEWPDKGEGFLPQASMRLELQVEGNGRSAFLNNVNWTAEQRAEFIRLAKQRGIAV